MTSSLTPHDQLDALGLTEEEVAHAILQWFEKNHEGEFKQEEGDPYTFIWTDTATFSIHSLTAAIRALASPPPHTEVFREL